MEDTTIVSQVWSKSRLLVKAVFIGIIILLLQIPSYYVQNLVQEREQRQHTAIDEVSSKWAGQQMLSGPVLVLPYWKMEGDSAKRVRSKHFAYFLPEILNIDAALKHQVRHRGIFKVILYTGNVQLNGSFSKPNLQKLNVSPADVLWNEASIKLPVTDNKGLNDEIVLSVANTPVALAPQTSPDPAMQNALQTDDDIRVTPESQSFSFEVSFRINGSQQMMFQPLGKATTVTMKSDWKHPSFVGDALPQSSSVSDSGFTAMWKSASHNRNFPQQWVDGAYRIGEPTDMRHTPDYVVPMTTAVGDPSMGTNISSNAFGARLFVPINNYQQTSRSIKYATLIILLTFAAFFLMENRNGSSIHPIHYGLVGVALLVFYTLLLSISEYISFNLSYLIASVCTIGLIGWFVKGLMQSKASSILITLILVVLYTYIFTLLQLQDYALLLGSIGLFVTVAIIMYYSRSLKW